MKILTIVGARPQIIKAAALSGQLRKKHTEVLLHTGQHYDNNMSDIFFDDMNIPHPDINLNIIEKSQAAQISRMIDGIAKAIAEIKPDALLVYGDTNSTLAGAIAASKNDVLLFHVEAGLRSFDKSMPEEQNRIVTDHLSDMLFAPTLNAVNWLKNEGIINNVYQVGDIMYDNVLRFSDIAEKRYKKKGLSFLKPIFTDIKKCDKWYIATMHRAENTNTDEKINELILACEELPYKVIFPVHPRIKEYIIRLYQKLNPINIIFCEPTCYTLMNWLIKRCEMILTDSGGLQKESYILKVPCVTLRNTTSWKETLDGNWNVLTNTINKDNIINNVLNRKINDAKHNPKKYYGDGQAAIKIAECIENCNRLEVGGVGDEQHTQNSNNRRRCDNRK